MQEQGNRERRWLRLHAITAPIGVAAVTAVLGWLGQSSDESQPVTLRFLNSAAAKVYLATVTYALIAAVSEGVARMFFWAWEDHKNRMERARERARNEGRSEGLNEGRNEGRAEGLNEGRNEGRAEAAREYENALAAARERARAEGVDLDKYLNP